MKRKVLSVLLCAGLAVSMLAGCGSDSSNANKKAESTGSDLEYVKDKGTLVVGVTDFEPMDYKDDNGEWIGFDADMAKAFASVSKRNLLRLTGIIKSLSLMESQSTAYGMV